MTETQEKFDICEKIVMHAKRITRAVGRDARIPIVCACDELIAETSEVKPSSKINKCIELIDIAKKVDAANRRAGGTDISFYTNEDAWYKNERANERHKRLKERRKNAENLKMDVDS